MSAPAVVRERPLLMSGPMVRAILDGKKSQTRRAVKPQPNAGPRGELVHLGESSWGLLDGDLSGEWKCPYGQPGDRLWVRETWWSDEHAPFAPLVYHADNDWNPEFKRRWRPSIHMPRWASRLSLEITEVRVERLQEITAEGCIAEGIPSRGMDRHGPNIASALMYISDFTDLWNSLNDTRGYGWDANPWVWVIAFRRVTDSDAHAPQSAVQNTGPLGRETNHGT